MEDHCSPKLSHKATLSIHWYILHSPVSLSLPFSLSVSPWTPPGSLHIYFSHLLSFALLFFLCYHFACLSSRFLPCLFNPPLLPLPLLSSDELHLASSVFPSIHTLYPSLSPHPSLTLMLSSSLSLILSFSLSSLPPFTHSEVV